MRTLMNFYIELKLFVNSQCKHHIWKDVVVNRESSGHRRSFFDLISMKAIRFPVNYRTLLPRGEISIISMYPILKKHLDLTKFCVKYLTFQKMSTGIQLFCSNGWQVNLELIPEVNIDTSIDVPSVWNYKRFAYQYFNKIK